MYKKYMYLKIYINDLFIYVKILKKNIACFNLHLEQYE